MAHSGTDRDYPSPTKRQPDTKLSENKIVKLVKIVTIFLCLGFLLGRIRGKKRD